MAGQETRGCQAVPERSARRDPRQSGVWPRSDVGDDLTMSARRRGWLAAGIERYKADDQPGFSFIYSPIGIGGLIGLLFLFIVLPTVTVSTLPTWGQAMVVGAWLLLCCLAAAHWIHRQRR